VTTEILYTGKALRKHLGRNILRRKTVKPDLLEKVLEFFESGKDDWKLEFAWCDKYGEPGYNDPETLILFGNWNYIDRECGQVLDELGFETEWCDEWTVVNDKAYRTRPNSYDWLPQLHLPEDSCEYITPDDPISVWIEAMQDNYTVALPTRYTEEDLTALGWDRIDVVYENGFHPGQDDNPEVIARVLDANDDIDSYIFRLRDKGQFDCRFEVYVMRRVECTSCHGTGEGICEGDECSCCQGDGKVRSDHAASGREIAE
jgi:hypothetical protein